MKKFLFYLKGIFTILLSIAALAFIAKTSDMPFPLPKWIETIGWNFFGILFGIAFGLSVGLLIFAILSIFDSKKEIK